MKEIGEKQRFIQSEAARLPNMQTITESNDHINLNSTHFSFSICCMFVIRTKSYCRVIELPSFHSMKTNIENMSDCSLERDILT